VSSNPPPVRVFDRSGPVTPYASHAKDLDAWQDIANAKWGELGLPRQPPPDPSWERCYLRWGDCPPDGRSFNYQLWEYEQGVAVFRAHYDPENNRYLIDLERSPLLAVTYVRLSTSGRRLYRVYGKACGLGGGG
jgi:hypothetical protein